MCGIGGVARLGKSRIEPESISAMLVALRDRGGDASGVALMRGKEIQVCKKDMISNEFITSELYLKFLEQHLHEDTDIALVHTRAATKGPVWKNENNHPVYAGVGAAVHNGVVHNDDELFRTMPKIARKAEVDSDIFRAIVDEYGISQAAIQQLQKVSGSAAVAAIHPAFPRKLMLLRSGSPLILAVDDAHEQLLFASHKKALYLASRRWERRYGIDLQTSKCPLLFNSFLTDAALLLDLDKMAKAGNDPTFSNWHDKFASSKHYVTPRYAVNDNYSRKQDEKAQAKKKEEVKGEDKPSVTEEDKLEKCVNPACDYHVSLTPEQQRAPRWQVACEVCKTPLAEPPKEQQN